MRVQALILALALLGCSTTPTPLAGYEPLPLADSVTSRNTKRLGWLIAAGQPSESDLDTFRDYGVECVINLRTAQEMAELDYDEAAAAEERGMHYVHLPFGQPETLTDEVLEAARAALRESRGTPTLLHCRSANRIGGPLLAYLALDEKMPVDEAAALAKSMGLRSEAIEARARDYVAKQR